MEVAFTKQKLVMDNALMEVLFDFMNMKHNL